MRSAFALTRYGGQRSRDDGSAEVGLPSEARSSAGQAHLRASRYGGHPSPAFMSEGWSGLRGSNPSDWLGKPGHYHYAKPAGRLILSGSDESENLVPLLLHQLGGEGLEIQAQHRLGVRAADVEMPVREFGRDAVH